MSRTTIWDLPTMEEISKEKGISIGTVQAIIKRFCESVAYNMFLRGYTEVDLQPESFCKKKLDVIINR